MGRPHGQTGARRPRVSIRTLVIASSIATVVLIGVIIVRHQTAPAPRSQSTAATVPHYQTVLPTNKSIDQLGGWRRISPPGKDPVFAYTDHIGSIAVTVSQQQLPKPMQQHAGEQTADIAKKFNATTKLTAGTITAYIGSSSKGPQSVIFTKGRTLILIKSQQTITDEAWKQYILSLN